MATTIDTSIDIQGSCRAQSFDGPALRTNLNSEALQAFPIQLTDWFVWDSATYARLVAPTSDDLGYESATWATSVPFLSCGDSTGGSLSRFARTLFKLPKNYVNGESVRLNFAAGMNGAVASTSTLLDAEVYLSARTSLKTGSDLVTTAATSMNSLTFAEIPFVVTSTGLIAGSWLDIRINIATVNVTASTIIPRIAHAEVLCTTKG